MGTLLIRADASVRIGAGHVMRCLALAQAWQEDGGDVILLSSPGIEPWIPRLEAEKIRVRRMDEVPGSREDAAGMAALVRETSAVWAVLDGYAFTPEYQGLLGQAGVTFLFIDDEPRDPSPAAALTLHPGLQSREGGSHRGGARRTLLEGGRHLLLRKEFLPWRTWTRAVPPAAARILITLGGSDPDNLASRVVEAIGMCRTRAWEAMLVVGPSNPHGAELQARIEEQRLPIRVRRGADDMASLMSWADVAVSAAGSTSWELAFMGLPAVLVVSADNQRTVAASMTEAGVAVSLGEASALGPEAIADHLDRLGGDAPLRGEMSRKGRILVDGGGARRVVARMHSALLEFREARAEDARLLWEWANDPEIRSVSFTPEAIPWERHLDWFRQKLGSSACILLIVTDVSGHPLGQIRFDLEDREAVVSVSLSRESRGRGWGAPLIERACRRVFESSRADVIHAYIKESNPASEQAFQAAGFVNRGAGTPHHEKASHWVLPKESLR
ncbi:MAG TPA: UDP-2,4-diacetamido-2,4,6-trideoxy-beta-L-altropyranose hydrolase [Planctomycetota bacterium]|nr:UDP-2,4-diacetamido-2,4,6-trideoxy-beta-L-altropyranose hydrolase [Planctomycetota bacterium]